MDGTQSEPRTAVDPSVKRTSSRLWGLDWSEHLPWQIGEVEVSVGRFEEALPFIREHYARLFGTSDDGRFLVEPMTAARVAYYREADTFLIRAERELVGIHIAHPIDWNTYYLRTLALMPTFRGAGFYVEMNRRMEDVLRAHGAERIEVDVSPLNIASMKNCMQRNYVVTGSSNSERWGSMLRYTKFLTQRGDERFRAQFIVGDWPSRREREPGGRE